MTYHKLEGATINSMKTSIPHNLSNFRVAYQMDIREQLHIYQLCDKSSVLLT